MVCPLDNEQWCFWLKAIGCASRHLLGHNRISSQIWTWNYSNSPWNSQVCALFEPLLHFKNHAQCPCWWYSPNMTSLWHQWWKSIRKPPMSELPLMRVFKSRPGRKQNSALTPGLFGPCGGGQSYSHSTRGRSFKCGRYLFRESSCVHLRTLLAQMG